VVTRRLQAERRTGSVHRPKTGVPPTVLRNQPRDWQHYHAAVTGSDNGKYAMYVVLFPFAFEKTFLVDMYAFYYVLSRWLSGHTANLRTCVRRYV